MPLKAGRTVAKQIQDSHIGCPAGTFLGVVKASGFDVRV